MYMGPIRTERSLGGLWCAPSDSVSCSRSVTPNGNYPSMTKGKTAIRTQTTCLQLLKAHTVNEFCLPPEAGKISRVFLFNIKCLCAPLPSSQVSECPSSQLMPK